MSDQTIYRLLCDHLNDLSFSPTPDIAWNTDKYSPTSGTAFLEPYYREDGNRTISNSPVQTHSDRTFEVQCFVPERKGMDEALKLAEAVSEHFFPSGEPYAITSGSIRVHINKRPDKDPLVARHAGFVGVAVLIRCFALL